MNVKKCILSPDESKKRTGIGDPFPDNRYALHFFTWVHELISKGDKRYQMLTPNSALASRPIRNAMTATPRLMLIISINRLRNGTLLATLT